MNRYIKPMLAAVIATAAACSPTDELHTDTIANEAELTISVNTQELTRAMIADSVLPDGSELCIGIFTPDGSNYMGKNYGHLYYKAENGPGTRHGSHPVRFCLVRVKESCMPAILILNMPMVTSAISISRQTAIVRMTSCMQGHIQD